MGARGAFVNRCVCKPAWGASNWTTHSSRAQGGCCAQSTQATTQSRYCGYRGHDPSGSGHGHRHSSAHVARQNDRSPSRTNSVMQSPQNTLATQILITTVNLYRNTLSLLMLPACRFYPTCSEYALESLCLHGAMRGAWRTLLRLMRCHAFSPGGYDPAT